MLEFISELGVLICNSLSAISESVKLKSALKSSTIKPLSAIKFKSLIFNPTLLLLMFIFFADKLISEILCLIFLNKSAYLKLRLFILIDEELNSKADLFLFVDSVVNVSVSDCLNLFKNISMLVIESF